MEDQNQVAEVTTEETPELDSAAEKAFEDDDWGDYNTGTDDDDFDLGEAEETEAGDTNPKTEEAAEPEQKEPAARKGNVHKLKHLGEEKEFDLDDEAQLNEVLTLAQKGMDYDHVREERDGLKPMKEYEDFLQEVVKRSGAKDIGEQILRSRAMWLMQDEAEKGNDISEADAILRIQSGKHDKPADKPAEQPKEQDAQHEMLMRFIDEYPDVKAESIPKEVWDDCAKNGDLVSAYRKYEIAQLKAENKKLKENESNRQRSTGSRRTAGATTPKDVFDEAWDSDD
jgi:hypothetical protein